MKRCVLCSSCGEINRIKSQAATRPDLQLEKGDYFEIRCKNCGNLSKVHVNDVRAEISNTSIYVAVGVGVAVTVALWNYYGAIGGVSFAIPIMFWAQESKNVHLFNSYLVKRK